MCTGDGEWCTGEGVGETCGGCGTCDEVLPKVVRKFINFASDSCLNKLIN